MMWHTNKILLFSWFLYIVENNYQNTSLYLGAEIMKKILLSFVFVVFSTGIYANEDYLVCQKSSCPIYKINSDQVIGALTYGQKAKFQYRYEKRIQISTDELEAGVVKISDIKFKGDFENGNQESQEKIVEYTKISEQMKNTFASLTNETNQNHNLFTRDSVIIEFDDTNPNQKATIIKQKTIDIEECAGSAMLLVVSDNGNLASDIEGSFWVKEFPKMKNGLEIGLSVQDVKTILGTPTRESSSMLTYSLKESDSILEYTDKEVVEFLRIYFVEGKLLGIWVIPYPAIC